MHDQLQVEYQEREGWVIINNVPTYVKSWGKWIEDASSNDSVILFIPATLGIAGLYDKFLSTLYLELKIPVWVVSHAGIQIPPASKNLVIPSIQNHQQLYNLQGQIEHKKLFIDKYITKDRSIYLIGHSIGAKICIELMKQKQIAIRTKQIYLLFPAIQHLANTPKGWRFNNIWNRITPFLIFFAYIFNYLPYYLRYLLVHIAITLRWFIINVEPCYLRSIIELCNPISTRCILTLAESAMLDVRDLDHEIYSKYRERIRAYFSATDSWVPLEHYKNLCRQHPYVKSVLLDQSYFHDFIVQSSVQMAIIISTEFKTFHKM